jgi:anti-sigma factor NepR-like protein
LPLSERNDATTHQDGPTRNRLMRIYLPEGVVRVMALTRHQEFLLSYSIQDNRSAAEVTDRDDGGTGKIKAARKPAPDAPFLDREAQDHIGQQLRAMYEQLLEEPVPGHLLMLMARLERQDREQSDAC